MLGPASPAWAATLTNVGFAVSNPAAGATGTTYTFTFTLTTNQNLTSFTMTVPPGTGGTPSGVTATGLAPYLITFPTGTPTLSGTTLTVPFTGSTWGPAGTAVTVTVGGLTNTSTPGDYTSTVMTRQSSTTIDSGTSSAVKIAGAELASAYWWPSTPVTSTTGATYDIVFTTTTTATLTTITATGPPGISGTPSVASVSGIPSGGSVTRSGSTLTYSFGGAAVTAGTVITLSIGGITNPSAGGFYAVVLVTSGASGAVDGGTANGVRFTGTGMNDLSWTPSSTTAGATGVSYSYGFTTTTGADTNSVTFSVPPGTTAPSLSVSSLVIDPGYSLPVSGVSAALSGTTITLSFTSGYVKPAHYTVVFEGITNTATPGTYGSAIATYAGSTPGSVAVPAPVAFVPPSAALGSVTWSASTTTVGATGVTYTTSAVLPTAMTLTAIAMTVPAGTSGTPGVGSVSPAAISGGSASLSGTTLTYTFPSAALPSGATFSVEFTGLTNTSTLQSFAAAVTVLDGATAGGSGSSNTLTFTSAGLDAPTWSADVTTVGATDATYTYTFGIVSGVHIDSIRMSVPPGTSGTPVLIQLTNAGPSPHPFTGGAITLSGTTLVVTFDDLYAQPGWTVTVVVSGMTNTPAPGSYTSSIVTRSGTTSLASGTTGAQAFTSVSMAGISWSASSSVVNTAGVTYAYAFSLSETTTIDTVTMTVPAGTAGTPSVGTVTPTAIAGGTVSLSGTTLTYTLPSAQSVSSTSTVQIAVAGLTNTSSAGTYTSSLSVKLGGEALSSGTSPGVSFTATALTNPSWESSSQSTNIASTYTFGLTTTAGTYTSMTFTVPAGTTGTPSIGSIDAYNQYGAVTFSGTSISRTGTTVTFAFASQYFQPNTTVSLDVAGLTNTPTAGSYSSTITIYLGTNPLASAVTSALAFSSISVGTAAWSSSASAVGATGTTYTFGVSISAPADVSSITMTVPAGTGGTYALGTVTPAAFAGGSLTSSGNTLTYSFAETPLAAEQVVSITVNGITNTSTTSTYASALTLYDDNATIIASGTSSSITFTATTLSGVTWSPSSTITSQSGVDYTWEFTTASANTLNEVTMTVPAGTAGSASLVSATTSPSVTLAGAAISFSGTTVTLSFGSVTVPSGTTFTVEVSGFTNTAAADSYSSAVTTRATSGPRDSGVSAPVSFSPSPTTALTWTMSSLVAGTAGITQTFAFATSTSATIDEISVALPEGTSGTPTIESLTPASIATGATASLSGATLTISFPATALPSATAIGLQVSGLTQTSAAGSYVATATTRNGGFDVDTAESDPQTVAARELSATIACDALNACENLPSGSTQVTILLIPGLPTPVTASLELEVKTNAPFGYIVNVASSTLTSASAVIEQASTGGAATIVVDRFGASAVLDPGGVSGAALCGAYAGPSAQIGYGTTETPLWEASAGTGATTDIVVLSNHLKVSTTQPAGLYTGTISYSVQPRYTAGSGC